MKAGMVVQVRVNPGNCQAILDIMRACNIDPYDGRSFSQCVSISLDALIGMARRAGVIGEVDPYQYLNEMGPFLGSGNNKRKHRYDQELYNRASHGVHAPDLTPQFAQPAPYVPAHLQQGAVGWTENGPVANANVPLQMDEETKRMLIEEMGLLDDRRNAGEKLTEEEMERYRYLNDKLFT